MKVVTFTLYTKCEHLNKKMYDNGHEIVSSVSKNHKRFSVKT